MYSTLFVTCGCLLSIMTHNQCTLIPIVIISLCPSVLLLEPHNSRSSWLARLYSSDEYAEVLLRCCNGMLCAL